MLIEKSVKDFVYAVSSKEPAPGGGSVSALVGSLGAALTNMVGNLTVGKKTYEKLDEEHKKAIDENMKLAQESIEKLNNIIDADTAAFNEVMAAFKMPKETDEDKKKRSQAIQDATKGALEVPLKAARECLNVLKLQKVFVLYGNKNAITDIGVGALLAYAGLEGAIFNVKINLSSIKDEEYVKSINDEVDNILKEGKELRDELLKGVYSELN
jgi:formiminotetrahydrofolate cyclodeaminase